MTADEKIAHVKAAAENMREIVYRVVPHGHRNNLARRLIRAARVHAEDAIRRGGNE